MLTKMAKRLTIALIPDCSDEQERAMYEYGCELWLYTVFSTLGLVLIGTVLGCPFEAIVMISIFYLCQSNGGGYHASTHIHCFLTMAVGMLLGLLLVNTVVPFIAAVTALSASTAILLFFPLYLHPKKRYLSVRRRTLEKRSRIVTMCIVLCVVVSVWLVPIRLFYVECFAMLFSAISRGYAIWMDTKQQAVNAEIENNSDSK